MARGPLPSDTKRRRNAPTIPTTELSASGRQGPAPDSPYELAGAGLTFWEWAWALPQALAWDDGALYTVARRAQLEDDLAAADPGGRNGVMKEMRELDNRLGLNPKGLADLRWTIVADEEQPAVQPAATASERRARLSVVGE